MATTDAIAPDTPPATPVVARFRRREKRFTVHAELADGTPVLAHTNNTGRMTGCATPGARCWLDPAPGRRRKLPWSLRVMEAAGQWAGRAPGEPAGGVASDVAGVTSGDVAGDAASGVIRDTADPVPLDAPAPAPGHVLVGVDTAAPATVVTAAIAADMLPGLAGCRVVGREVRYPATIAARSRADLLLAAPDGGRVWVEIKNVTWVQAGCALFPDAPTVRGRKHLDDLVACVAAGDRAALVFCVQRADAREVAAATVVDTAYAAGLDAAAAAGVGIFGLQAHVAPAGPRPWRPLPVRLAVEREGGPDRGPEGTPEGGPAPR
jgi:sugar fermentation stimulation protein A